jgi:tetratricopeptide (TPR) repeat protein
MNERDIFIAALEMASPNKRRAYLDHVCQDDTALRGRVEELLEVHERAGSFLNKPISAPVLTGDYARERARGHAAASPSERVLPKSEAGAVSGQVIGPYKLVQEIGEGGMGEVWLAQQQEPVKRQVALKLVKPWMDSRSVLARFEAERQALALMDHPNIAKVFDAGATPDGRPYFVMELVKGVRITQFCDERRLTPRQRLELFVPVCQAIQHAHQKGIIHRDIKPSNVLVALYDDRPVPKVIDFGVAKATGQQLTEKTLHTGLGAVVGTVEYMSPEQAGFNQLDVDTRSDVYALGVLLYELLTGSPPFTKKELAKAGMLEMLRVIREQEPSRPSTKLSTAEGLPTLAANRGTEPAKLTRLVRGEVDWIVMKALEKDRNRRYETANGFAADVQRYLADEPVQACPPSAGYRFRKFARRNKTQLAIAGLILFFLILLGGGGGWVMRDRAARRAVLEERVGQALHEAAERQAQGRWTEALAAARRAEELLGPGGSEELRRRAHQLRADLEMVAKVADIRLQFAAVNADGHFDHASRDPAYAQVFREYGLDLAGDVGGPEAAQRIRATSVVVELAAAVDDWAAVCRKYRPEADATWKELSAIARAADPDPLRNQLRDAWERGDVKALADLAASEKAGDLPAPTVIFLAEALADTGAVPAAVDLLRRAQLRHPADFWINHDLAQALERMQPPSLDEAIEYYRAALTLRPESPGVHLNLGNPLREKGRLDEAIAAYQEAIRLKKDYAGAHNNLGNALRDKGRLDEAIAEFQEAFRLKKDFAEAHANLGVALQDKGRLDEAIAEYREAIRLKNFAGAHYNLGTAFRAKGRLDEAIAEYREAIRLKKDYAEAHYNLGVALQDKGRLDEATAEYHKATRLKKDYAEAHCNLGTALHLKGRLDEAIAEYHKAIRLKKDYAEAHMNLGVALQDKGRMDEAIAEYHEAIHLKKDYAEAHYNLGTALRDKGRLDEAIAELQEAIRLKKDFVRAQYDLATALHAKATALHAKGQVDEAIAAIQQVIRLKKDYAEAHYNLGVAWHEKGRLDEAIAEYHEAIRLKKDYAEAHCNLGNALRDKGRLDEAIDEYQEAIRLKKDLPEAHYNLGSALRDKGRLDEAITEFTTAIRLRPDNAATHRELGVTLYAKGRLDEAIAAYQEAIRLKKDDAVAYHNLGDVLRTKGRLDESIAAIQEAIRLKKDFAEAHCNLGHTLLAKGQFAQALASLRRGHELGSPRPQWRYPSAQWVRNAGRLVALEDKLPDLISRKVQPADTAECLTVAQLCQTHKKRYAAAARFYADAFAAKPKLIGDGPSGLRYDAACAAALAGCAQGEDAKSLDAQERGRLRRQALDWIRAELDAWGKLLDTEPDKARPVVIGQMRHWQADADFAGVRGQKALAQLPVAERQLWQELWGQVADLLARAQPRPEKKGDAK